MSLKEVGWTIKQDLFEESLVTQVNNFGDPIKWATFFMAHIYHRFDTRSFEAHHELTGSRGLYSPG